LRESSLARKQKDLSKSSSFCKETKRFERKFFCKKRNETKKVERAFFCKGTKIFKRKFFCKETKDLKGRRRG